jgi:hypothetical protein
MMAGVARNVVAWVFAGLPALRVSAESAAWSARNVVGGDTPSVFYAHWPGVSELRPGRAQIAPIDLVRFVYAPLDRAADGGQRRARCHVIGVTSLLHCCG